MSSCDLGQLGMEVGVGVCNSCSKGVMKVNSMNLVVGALQRLFFDFILVFISTSSQRRFHLLTSLRYKIKNLFICCLGVIKMKNIDYSEAQKDESVRQKFLNKFLKNNPGKGVSRLVYDKEGQAFEKFLEGLKDKGQIFEKNYKNILKSSKEHEGIDMDLLAFCPRSNIGRGIESRIFVLPACFSLNYENFISVLVDHEYIHAKHVKEGIILKEGLEISYLNQQQFNPQVLLMIDEVIAYNNTIEKAKEKNNNSKCIKGAQDNLEEFKKNLRKIKKFSSIVEEAVVKFMLVNP